MELNKYFFEALRLRLENILRALSNNRKAHIVYSTSIATDVRNTVYLQARDYIEPDVKPALTELLLFYKACVSHEGAHIRFTSLNDWKEACNRGTVFQHLTNIIEDGRIESAISQVLPGTGRWIKFTNQYVYNHRKPETYGTGLQAFLMGLNVYSILQTVPPFLSPEIQRLIKLAAPYVDIGRAASSTKEVLECVENILSIPEIKSLVDASSPPPIIEGDKGTTSPEQATPSEETSERAEKAKEIIKRRKSRNSDKEKSDHEKASSTETEKEDDNANNEDDNIENEDSQESSNDSDTEDAEDTSDNTDNSEETLENLDEDSDKEIPDSEDSDTSDNDAGKETDNAISNEETSESPDEDIKDEDTPDPEETSESPDEDDDDLEASGNSEECSNDDSSDDVPEGNQSDDDLSDNDSEDSESDDDLSDDDSEDSGIDDNVELDSSVEGHENPENNDSENGTPESLDSECHGDPGNSSNDENDEEEFFRNPPEQDFEELLEDTSNEVLTLTKEAENIEEENTPEDILEGIPANIHGGVELCEQNLTSNPTRYQILKKQNEVLIKNLVNEIKVALETRKAYDLHSLNRGRLHSGSLWKLAVPDPTVFSRRVIPGDIPELAVYILVDLSGSMSEQNTYPGPTRIQSVKNATCVLSEAMRELKIIHAVTGFNSYHPITYHYPAVTWEDTDSVKIASFRSTHSNRDGFSIRVAANELSYRQEPKKILFILSDGQPADYGGYVNNLAWNDVKQAVFETKQKGIKVISMFFGEECLVSTFKFMYDTPVFVPDLTVLPRALGEVFKRVYLE